MKEDGTSLEHFSGTVRLFPLPNVVLFPQVVQPLHIFEPRYRQMTVDALADDRLIAPVLLRPGWDADYEGQPAVQPVLCVGRIVAEQRMPDGRFNLLLRGVSRARIVEELPSDKLYRSARVELTAEGPTPTPDRVRWLRERIGTAVQPWFPDDGPALRQLEKLVQNPELPLGVLCDLLGFAAPLLIEAKQQLLETTDIEERAQLLLQFLQVNQPPTAGQQPAKKQKFPPDFSCN
ncbi:MAG: LON peptidase substrate-binding domain-containing protein [Planctomycetia bacterium]|nr:LON peptidase substrate-binding domain-containing protein [Planctomycetia bacterium]